MSIWVDSMSRGRVRDGHLADLIANKNVVGLVSGVSSYPAAVRHDRTYRRQAHDLGDRGSTVFEIATELVATDARLACDMLRDTWRYSGGADGRVLFELDTQLASDERALLGEAIEAHSAVGRPNVLVAVPATYAGLSAMSALVAEGFDVGVEPITSAPQYRGVAEAYLDGLERAAERDRDLSALHSVAGVVVSGIDAEVDRRLHTIGTPEALSLLSRAGNANRLLVEEAAHEVFRGKRWEELAARGARVQRLLWTGRRVDCRDPGPDGDSAPELTTPGAVVSVPEPILRQPPAWSPPGPATSDHLVTGRACAARATLEAISTVGVDLPDALHVVQAGAVAGRARSWADLRATVAELLAEPHY